MIVLQKPQIYRNVINEEERLQLYNHATHLLQTNSLKVNEITPGDYRNYKSFYNTEELAPIHQQLYHKVINVLNIKIPIIDPFLGMIISVIKPGGYIHRHKDPYNIIFPQYSDNKNIRFNVMIERDEDDSYNPIIEDVSYRVNKCDAWCFDASTLEHETVKLIGNKNRIVYQFGFMVDAK
jgi:hypothetical protein